jgi:exodeoxyribonuclease III
VWDLAAFPEGSTHVTGPEREAVAALAALGMVDAQRAVLPRVRRSRGGTTAAGRSTVATGCASTSRSSPGLDVACGEVDRVARRNNEAGDKPSDHAPVVVDLSV